MRFEFTPSDIDKLITNVDNVINIIVDDRSELDREHIQDQNESGKTNDAEIEEYNNMLERYDAEIRVLEQIKDGLQEFLDQLDDNVGLQDTIEFVFEEGEVKPILTNLTYLLDGNSEAYRDIVKESNVFDIWEETIKLDLINITEKEKKEKEAYKKDRELLNDLNDYLYKKYNEVEDMMDDINIAYKKYFEPLEDDDLVNNIINFMDLDISDINKSDFEPHIEEYKEGRVEGIGAVSEKGIEFLKNFEMSDSMLSESYNMDINEQMPYHVVMSYKGNSNYNEYFDAEGNIIDGYFMDEDGNICESIWTIGFGITASTEQGCYDRINEALGYEGDEAKNAVDGDIFTKQEIDEATKYIINNEYAIYINPQIDDYNNSHEIDVKPLTQEQFDSINQFYWNCGKGGGGYYDGFYDDVVEAQALIEEGSEESLKLAEDKMTDAFDNYRKGTPGFDSDADTRSEEAADLFVNGNY